jgi:hypothetical protein
MANGNAATYYVRSGGDDGGDGLSHDTAWRTLDKVNRFRFLPADRVFFREGDRWAGQLVVDWPGTADNPVIIGAYHLEGGTPARGARAGRPVIDGTDTLPQQFDGLVRVRADHVRIEDLTVINSEGRGIQFEDSDHGIVVDCETVNSYKSGIKFVRSDHAIVRGNFVTRAGVASPEDGGVWGGAIELVASDDGIIRGNTVAEVYGEGINVNHGSARSVIEGNYVFAARAVGIYVDAAPETTVRRNLVIGTSNAEFWRTGRSVGAGIALNNEDYHYAVNGGELEPSIQSQRARIYGNLVAYASSGVGFWGQFENTTFDGVLVFNNTLVDNDTQLVVRDKPKAGSRFVNNILVSLSPGTSDVDRNDLAGLTAKSNYFSQGDPAGDFRASGNFYAGVTLARTSGWRSVNDRNEITWRDFEIRPGSSVISRGDEEPRVMSQGDNTFDVDFNNLPHNAPMDLGALRFSAVAIKTPKTPARTNVTP